ncbi:anthranilate synthase component II [Tumebacillus permanentifrigoris]|uniref:Anthranilate synthase component 2/para-aminobenzoate synthetase component 2 n=1 Tax=Tumebacillus permanentifrigoris TaxID=378543 RepID=A0A316DRA6_9BACL|nr:gamma-glutamyl-gamma-aminobutyrate hydrolase family protein [Tumebacillus permanentifrigoris]PWK06986.1 anthranilate synthase component 2/para-aminobenzoate synthetase component 2 [Tumebacillus permanentifrigoris]
MIVVLDNYDGFTFHLVQFLKDLGGMVFLSRNDQLTIAEIEQLNPTHLVLTPGMGTPAEAGIGVEVVRHFAGRVPILGLGLGCEIIGHAFGAQLVQPQQMEMSGEYQISHRGDRVFSGIVTPFAAQRRHVAQFDRASLPEQLTVIAESQTGEVIGVRHRQHDVIGLQIHPEAVTAEGSVKKMIYNFVTKTAPVYV